MPRKERRKQEIAKAKVQKRLDALFQNIPEHAKRNAADPPLLGDISKLEQTCPELRLKGGAIGIHQRRPT